MDILGKWEVIKVLSGFNDDLTPIYVSKEEALKLDEFKDARSNLFITSIFDLKENVVNIIKDGKIEESMGAKIEDGKYYVFDTNEPDSRVEMIRNDDETITFMIMLVLKKIGN